MKRFKKVLKITVIIIVIMVFIISYIDFGFRGQTLNQNDEIVEEVVSSTLKTDQQTIPQNQSQPKAYNPADFWNQASTSLPKK